MAGFSLEPEEKQGWEVDKKKRRVNGLKTVAFLVLGEEEGASAKWGAARLDRKHGRKGGGGAWRKEGGDSTQSTVTVRGQQPLDLAK